MLLYAEPAEDGTADPGGTDAAAPHRGVAETEAESVAYVLAGMAGRDTGGYVAGWSDTDSDLIASTARRVLAAIRDLAAALDPGTEGEDLAEGA